MVRSAKRTALRLFGRLTATFSTYAVTAFVLLAASVAFVWELFRVEGTVLPATAVWALSTLPFLPLVGAYVASRAWCEDRASGYMAALLTLPVPERQLVYGRFLAGFAFGALVLAVHLVFATAVLAHDAPALAPQLGLLTFLPAYAGLLLPLALTVAVGVWAGLCARRGASTACLTLFLTLFLPAAFQAAVTLDAPFFRAGSGESPFLAYAQAAADGAFSLSGTAFYAVTAFVALFAASKRLAALRFVGSGARLLRLSSRLAVLSSLVFAVLVCAVSWRFDVSFTLPGTARAKRFSERTRQILAETRGDVTVTCFMSRHAPPYRALRRLLTGLAEESRRISGLRIRAEFADPRWNLDAAERLVREGCPEGGIQFRCGRRRIAVTNALDEASCAAVLLRLTRPVAREKVYWLVGHGETSWRDYDSSYGMSDLARLLQRDGYRIEDVDLGRPVAFEEDCAFVVSAGARTALSAVERKRVAGYLRKGGRLLVFARTGRSGDADGLLGEWGVSAAAPSEPQETDRTVRTFADHPLTRPLRGESLVFGSAAAHLDVVRSDGTNRLDGLTFTPLAADGGYTFAAALEYGGAVGRDLALRPMRLVAIGDPAFAVNGALARRANANADFVMNAASWLAGFDASTGVSRGADVLVTGLSDRRRTRYAVRACLLAPGAVLLLGGIVCLFRRRTA